MNSTVEGRTCTKAYRIDILKKDQSHSIRPESYTFNTENEKICLAVIDDFQSHFLEEQSEDNNLKNTLYAVAENEYKVLKCVCTTLKPELLPNPVLYDVDGCSTFIAEYVDFEPLEDPCKPPTCLPSPTQTLSWRVGDCFDLSILLTSYLIGAGYDAYVVYGIAPKWTCVGHRSVSSFQCTRITPKMHDDSNNPTLETSLDSAEDVVKQLNKLDDHNKIWKCNDNDDISYIKDEKEEDELDGKRVHCWVAVKADLRLPPGTVDFFIEPSTGSRYSCIDAHPYMKIFALWNTKNYWVKKSPDDVSLRFDFTSSEKWCAIFYNKSLTLDGKNMESSRKPFDPPFSWVGPLTIPKSSLDFCHPQIGQKVTLLHKTKIESFSEGFHKQGLLERITTYNDEKMVDVSSCVESFGKMRTDYLMRRVKLPKSQSFHEDYSSRHPLSVRVWMEECGKRRRIRFSDKGRSDGLICHDECFGKSIVHSYYGRRDGLYERVSYIRAFIGNKEKRNGSFIVSSTDGTQNCIVVKIVEKYKTAKITGADNKKKIASKCYDLEEKSITIEYLKGDEGIERDTIIRLKNKTERSRQVEDNHEVLNAEKSTNASLRSVMQEMTDLVRMRKREEDVLRIDYSRKDDAKSLASSSVEHQDTSEKENKKKRPQHLDYLAPFLLHVKDENNVTTEEAIQVKNACLGTCKERLLQRADIMQHRLNEEGSKLAKIQEEYQLNPDKNEETKNYFIKSNSELIFRIKILEKRLRDHQESSLEKYKVSFYKIDLYADCLFQRAFDIKKTIGYCDMNINYLRLWKPSYWLI